MMSDDNKKKHLNPILKNNNEVLENSINYWCEILQAIVLNRSRQMLEIYLKERICEHFIMY